MSRPEPILYKTNDDARIDTHTTEPWWRWTERFVDARLEAHGEMVGEVIGEHCGQQIAPLKRELELLRREVTQLREQIGLERELKELRDQIKTAKNQVPEFPKIAEDLAAGQRRLRRSVAAAEEKLSHLRVDQSLTTHRVDELSRARVVDKSKTVGRLEELRKATEATESKIDTLFPMYKRHPAADAALRNYAAEALNGETIYRFDSSSNPPDATATVVAAEQQTQMEPAASAPEE